MKYVYKLERDKKVISYVDDWDMALKKYFTEMKRKKGVLIYMCTAKSFSMGKPKWKLTLS